MFENSYFFLSFCHHPRKKIKIFSVPETLTHHMKNVKPHCPLLDSKTVNYLLYFCRLLNVLHMNSRPFLKCGLEIRHCVPLQNSVICLFLSFAPHSLPSGIFFFNLMAGILIIYHSNMRPVKLKILKVTL